MATVRTVEREIWDVEGFKVRIHHGAPGRTRGRDVRSDRQSLPGYGFKNARDQGDTVAAWVTGRFEKRYPGFSVVVLKGDGKPAHGKMLLANLRATYY